MAGRAPGTSDTPGATGAPGAPSPVRAHRTRAAARKHRTSQDVDATPAKSRFASPDRGPVPGPSPIKQCYRTVKSLRRVVSVPAASPFPPEASGSTAAAAAASAPAPQKRHECSVCHKRFGSPGKLSQHRLLHTGDLPFSCQHCDKRFNSKFKLMRHGLIHNETRPFSCSHCARTFHRKDHLANHARVHNPVKDVYVCERPDCNKQYTSPLNYKKHVALHSAEEGDLVCKICGRRFDDKAAIVYHLKVHAGSRTVKNETDKKFPCSVCNRRFFTAKDVRRHRVVHTGSRDFACQFCAQRFGRKDHLVRHVKKAHSEKFPQTSAPETTERKKGKGEGKRTRPFEAVPEAAPFKSEIDIKIEPEPEILTLTSPDVVEPIASSSGLCDIGEPYPDLYAFEPYPMFEPYPTEPRLAGDPSEMLDRPETMPLDETLPLPKFSEAFQNATQSPKPQRPPE